MTESPWSKTENPHNTSEHVKCSFDNKQRFFVSSKRKQRMSNDKTKSAEIAGKTLPPLSRSILRGFNKKGLGLYVMVLAAVAVRFEVRPPLILKLTMAVLIL